MPSPRAAPSPSPLLSFIVGSSLPAFGISLTYLGRAFSKLSPQAQTQIPIQHFPFAVAGILGLANIINTRLTPSLGYPVAPLVVGALTGLLLSFIGRFGLDLPNKLFKIPKGPGEHIVHPVAMALYAAIFTGIIAPLTAYVA
jgi:hypothetical protein